MPYTKSIPQLLAQSLPVAGSDVLALSVDSLSAFAKKVTVDQLAAYIDAGGSAVVPPDTDITYTIPTDFATLDAALEAVSGYIIPDSSSVTIVVRRAAIAATQDNQPAPNILATGTR